MYLMNVEEHQYQQEAVTKAAEDVSCTMAGSGSHPAAHAGNEPQTGCQLCPGGGRWNWDSLQNFSMGIQQDLFSDEVEVGRTCS